MSCWRWKWPERTVRRCHRDSTFVLPQLEEDWVQEVRALGPKDYKLIYIYPEPIQLSTG